MSLQAELRPAAQRHLAHGRGLFAGAHAAHAVAIFSGQGRGRQSMQNDAQGDRQDRDDGDIFAGPDRDFLEDK